MPTLYPFRLVGAYSFTDFLHTPEYFFRIVFATRFTDIRNAGTNFLKIGLVH